MGSKSTATRPHWGQDGVVVATADQVLWRELEGELVLYHPATDQVTHLDAIATQVWFRIRSAVSVQALISGLVKDFDAEPSRISTDVEALLDELFDADLIDVT